MISRGATAPCTSRGATRVLMGSVAYKSSTPTSKFVVVTGAPVEMPAGTRIPASQQVAVPA